ncbi:hypothetical protein T01_13032 [Trichinella spiralis]|uniref:Uncharacterized protein n=1 Tax=Trichinella spiralis TaxID=6334 RepID=A0A0V0YTP7_TRISP|nr:hypothetical protein T01_13032 [Trichinella spiralis]
MLGYLKGTLGRVENAIETPGEHWLASVRAS